jgi:hypothetical protein
VGPRTPTRGRPSPLLGRHPFGVVFCAVPANTFHRTPVIDHVATAAMIGTLLQQFHTGQVGIAADRTLEPAQSDASMRSRFWMLIPPCFVGEVLSAATQPKGLMPWDLWVTVVDPVVQENKHTQATIALFIEWSRLAYAGGIGSANPQASMAPPPLHFGGRLQLNRRRSLAQDLPDHFGPSGAPATATVAPTLVPVAAKAPTVERAGLPSLQPRTFHASGCIRGLQNGISCSGRGALQAREGEAAFQAVGKDFGSPPKIMQR